MASSSAATVVQYLAELPEDRRQTVAAVREVILRNLPPVYVETMQYGMVSYVIPLQVFPKTYNGQPLAAVSLSSEKNYISLHLFSIYADAEAAKWFETAFAEAGKKPNMGKSCVRFKKLEDLPLDVIGEAIAAFPASRLIELYSASRARR